MFQFEKPTEIGFSGDEAVDWKVILKWYEYMQWFQSAKDSLSGRHLQTE
jgi:hypothetical protein